MRQCCCVFKAVCISLPQPRHEYFNVPVYWTAATAAAAVAVHHACWAPQCLAPLSALWAPVIVSAHHSVHHMKVRIQQKKIDLLRLDCASLLVGWIKGLLTQSYVINMFIVLIQCHVAVIGSLTDCTSWTLHCHHVIAVCEHLLYTSWASWAVLLSLHQQKCGFKLKNKSSQRT